MVRSVPIFCAAVLAFLISAYALIEDEAPADFRYVNPSGIHTLDPARMSWTPDFRVAINIWEGLTSAHPRTTEPVEGAALFPPQVSDDGFEYAFTIRPDARWSDGSQVTASDFVRGWRRALEPGTAADYTFMFTDHIAGAADYVKWRLEAVTALTALSRLRDGWSIDAAQAKGLAAHPGYDLIRTEAGLPEIPSASDPKAQDLEALTARANRSDADWSRLYDRFFAEHVAELDERFNAIGISAVDVRTLVVTLTRPCPYFLDLTAFPTFFPCHKSIELLQERYRGAPITAQGLVVYDPQWTKPDYRRDGYGGLVTNGPYRVSDWAFKRRLRMTVNPHYRRAQSIQCRTIDMVVYDHISAAIMAYEAEDVDFLPSMDVPYDHEIAHLSRSGQRPDFYLCDVLATYFFNFNCVSEMVAGRPNPFVDPRVRKAFSLAVDREAIVDNVLKRGDRVANTFVPSGVIAGYDSPEGLHRNADHARRLLADAGFVDGEGLPAIQLLYLPADERICQAAARMWEEELGVRVELRCKESKTFAEDKAQHRYMIARGNWYADYYDARTFLDCLVTGNGNNDSGYSSPRYDELIAQARDTPEPRRRAEILQQAERLVVEEDLPILPILHYALPIAIKPNVKGLYPNARLRFPFQYITIER
ncbi:MAG: peptide ABC transporter substrate-binding protein [Phycisphaerales bacterium]|nr:MAG: peptide ABC transporter substrate-binding protein [Phycisphaerales bacterium]